ncbi:MAG: chemotaxis protein CheA [Verrucomicrobiota bacterium]
MKQLVAELSKAVDQGMGLAAQAGLDALLKRLHDCAAGNASQAQPAAAPSNAESPATPAVATPSPSKSHAAPAANQPGSATDSSRAASSAEATVKVSTDRLDSLINMVGELVIAQAMVKQDSASLAAGNHRLARNMAQLGKITRELQELSMSMRMVPIHGVFQKMTRLVRDLNRKFCKEVDLVTSGDETELDRNVVEAISDPLVHMVRNAIDHGIETPEQRVAAGKPRKGKLMLRACHRAGNVVIEIADDGKGLPKDKILKKAREAGIVGENEELTESEIFKLIFHAGLSTAEKVTDVSGRGVGMDVVRKNIEALRGRIDIASIPGQGTTFTIRLPLTLAVIDGLIVNVGDHRYIVPLTSVDQSVQPKPEQISTVQQRGEMVMIRGRLLPLVRLYKLFGCKPRNEDPTKALVVIVQDNDRQCCLMVDDLVGQQQVVIKSLGESLGAVRGVSGGAILGDGNVSLILDVPGVIDLASK